MSNGDSSAPRRRFVAIGGGGFLTEDFGLVMERWLLELTGRARPRVLYLGTAFGDSVVHQARFFRAFSALECRPSSLLFFPFDRGVDLAARVAEAELVYVGGGNTPAMLAVWRAFGLEAELRRAYESGTVVAGISAGANMAFERYVTDSVPGGGVRPGLGWLPGLFCPHVDSEVWRVPMLEAEPGPRAAAGEHVALLYEDERFVEALTDTDGPRVALRSGVGETLRAEEPRRLPSGDAH